MKDWALFDKEDESGVYILCGEKYTSKRRIYPDPDSKSKVELWLLYNNYSKLTGYFFKYKYDKIYPKFSNFNCFGIIYNKQDNINPENISLEVIFEDANIRLLAYEHKNGIRDYFLVGRWRTQQEIDFGL